MRKLFIKLVRLLTIHNIASYSLSVAERQAYVKTYLAFRGYVTIFSCGVGAVKTELCAGRGVVRAFRRVVEPRVGVSLHRISCWASAIYIWQVHVGATSKEKEGDNNNLSQFFFLSAEFTSSNASSGNVKYCPAISAVTAV